MARSLAFTPLIVAYTVEILPYSIRAKGFNVFNFVISAALIFNQYVNPIALEHIAWKYYVRMFLYVLLWLALTWSPQILYCCWLAFELAFCYFMIIETKNRTLEETAALFDGDDVAKAIVGTGIGAVQDVRHEDYDDKHSDSGYGIGLKA